MLHLLLLVMHLILSILKFGLLYKEHITGCDWWNIICNTENLIEDFYSIYSMSRIYIYIYSFLVYMVNVDLCREGAFKMCWIL